MISNYLKVAFRQIWKHKTFSSINIIGLSLGISACVFILIYVGFEMSYDEFRPENIYRVYYRGYQDNVETGKSAQVVPAFAPALRQDLPDIESVARLFHTGPLMSDPVMQAGEKIFRESRIYFADPDFMDIMGYDLLSGSKSSALAEPNQVALSRSSAMKYFNDVDVAGRTITFHEGARGQAELKVTAVFEDVPANSHVHTDFLVSFSTIPFNLEEDWMWGQFYTYVKISPQSNPHFVESKFEEVLTKHIGQDITAWAKDGYTFHYFLQPVRQIHLDSHLWGEAEANGDRNQVYFLLVVAGFILILAWVNYINFAISKSAEHAKEVGIRKISGSNQIQLFGQLMADAAIINLFAGILAVAIIQAALPVLNIWIGLPLLPFEGKYWMLLFMLFLAGSILSGIYPAYVISKHKAVTLLKSRINSPLRGFRLSRSLVVFQFAIAIGLIIATVVIHEQLAYMQHKDTGLNMERTLVVKGPGVKDSLYDSRLNFFRNEIRELPGVQKMSVCSSVPGQPVYWGREFYAKSHPEKTASANIVAVDDQFFDLFEGQFVAGNNFTNDGTENEDAIIFNETAARLLGYADPKKMINEEIIWHESDNNLQPKRVIGVVKDFNQESLKKRVEPMVFALKKYLQAPWAGEYFAYKLSGGQQGQSISGIKSKWRETFAENPFDYFFLDDFFRAQYTSDQAFGSVFNFFTMLAIVIACLGLFGLSSYVAIKRTKEIGVRKVLGSSVFGIVLLLCRDFVLSILLAFSIACPIAWYGMQLWLEGFAYQIKLSAWTFAGSGIAVIILALITVSWQSITAANRNPTELLRYE